MKFEIKKLVLENLLEKATCALPSKALGEQLNAIQLQVRSGSICLLCMDGDFYVQSGTPLVKVEGVDGDVVYSVPPKFKDVIYNSSADTLVLSSDGKELLIEADDKSENRLLLRSVERWILPEILWNEAVDVSRERFLNSLSRVKAAVCSDSGQPALMQAMVASDGVVGTNGARYHQVNCDLGVSLSIPQPILDALIKLLGMVEDVNVKVVDVVDKVGVSFGEDRIVFNKLAYEFPVWVKTMPSSVGSHKNLFYVNRQELMKAVKQVALLADENSKLMVCTISGNEMVCQAKDSFGNLSKAVVIGKAENADGMKIGLNHKFLQDALSALADVDVCIAMANDVGNRKANIVIRGENILCILTQISMS